MAPLVGAFISGIFCLAWFVIWPDSYGISKWLLITGVLFILMQKTWKQRVALVSVFLLGMGWAGYKAELYWHTLLPPSLTAKPVLVTGTVIAIPKQQRIRQRFILQVQQINNGTVNQNKKMLAQIDWYGSKMHLLVGDQWQLLLRLKPPRRAWNTGSMDYQAWLLQNNIAALGYVQASPFNRYLAHQNQSHLVDQWRQQLAEKIRFALHGQPLLGLITALAVGVRDDISEEQWNVLRSTGTNHLFAIAGLHIGLIAGFVYFLVNFVWRRLATLPLYFPAQQAATLAALVSAFGYSALAGFALPTQRAVIMLTVFLTAALLKKNISVWISWLLALTLVLILNPWEMLAASFWLSFITVALIIYGISDYTHVSGTLRHSLRVQWIIAVGLIPLSLWFFQQVSLASFIANVIAVPWVGFVVLPLSVLGSCLIIISYSLASEVLRLAEFALEIIWPILAHIADLEVIQWHRSINNPWILIAALVGVLFLLAPRGIPARYLGCAGFLPLFFWKPIVPMSSDVWISLLDSGAGITAVVQTQHHVLLYSNQVTGTDSKVFKSIVAPFLQINSLTLLDLLITNHRHTSIATGSPYTSTPVSFTVSQTFNCEHVITWQWDGVNFSLMPLALQAKMQKKQTACWLLINSDTHRAAILDNQFSPASALIVNNQVLKKRLPLDILIMQQNKFWTLNSASNLIVWLQPKWLWVSSDSQNGLLQKKSIMPLKNNNQITTNVLTTAEVGEIQAKLQQKQPALVISNYRAMHHYFWF